MSAASDPETPTTRSLDHATGAASIQRLVDPEQFEDLLVCPRELERYEDRRLGLVTLLDRATGMRYVIASRALAERA